jgi:hypothetical protein
MCFPKMTDADLYQFQVARVQYKVTVYESAWKV